MSKSLNTMFVAAVSGATAAYLLTSKKGKEWIEKVDDMIQDYQDNPEHYHQLAKEKTISYANQVSEAVNYYKDRVLTGELSTDDVVSYVKEKTSCVSDYATNKWSDLQEQVQENTELPAVGAQIDDIVIDYIEVKPKLIEEKIEK